MATVIPGHPFLSTRRGKLTLLLLCAVQFLDIVDSSIVNVALPSIRSDLHFSQQNLQWVLSGYLLTYGGFLLLGGRAADLLGRRRLLVAGTSVFALSSLAGGLAPSAGVLVGARVVQGIGAAMMAPAGLSILTTTFTEGTDRTRALGAWGAISGLAAAVGVFTGGLLSEGPGWRWVLFVNLPVCAAVLAAAFRLVRGDRRTAPMASFDARGAVLVTGGMLLLVYALVRAPDAGWGSAHTIGELGTALALLAAFAVNELHSPSPLFPLSVFRIKGLAAADATQLIAFAGFISMFFFLTLYMQNVLAFSPVQAGAAYLPVTAGIAVAAGISTKLFPRTGTRPVIVAGTLIAAGGMYDLSRIGIHSSYLAGLLPGLLIMSIGLGAVFVAVTTAANAGVPADQAGLAASLLSTSLQLGSALGLAIFTAIATARTHHLLAVHASPAAALTAGFHRALLDCSIFLVAAGLIATRASSARGQAPGLTNRKPAPAKEPAMKYLLQIYLNDAMTELGKLSQDQQDLIFGEYYAVMQTPGVADGHQLQPPATATTVQVQDGRTLATDGPFAGTKEPLGGYYLVEADSLGSAIELAARIPAARMGGAIEIRPVIGR